MKKIIFLLLLAIGAVAAENFDSIVSVSSSAGGTVIVASNTSRLFLCLQNVGTQIEYCAKGANVPTSVSYGFSLLQASVAGAADGGKQCLTDHAAIYSYTCIAASGTGSIARSTGAR